MNNIEIYIIAVKIVVPPIVAWAAWTTRMIYKAQKDLDFAHYKLRNGQGMRSPTMKAKLKRVTYGIRNGKNGEHGCKDGSGTSEKAGDREVSSSNHGASPENTEPEHGKQS